MDIQNVLELLKIAQFDKREESPDEESEVPELEATTYQVPEDLETIQPIISVDGSYCFLFSFLGTETWVVLFRIAVTEYCIEIKKGKVHYCIKSSPKIYDHLNVLSFNSTVLSHQPGIFTTASEVARGFQERKAQIFASNVMTYFEDKVIEKISASRKDCIILKDGALLTFKALHREDIYKRILVNCKMNNISFAGISKSTSTHFLGNIYTDDYTLKRFYNYKYSGLTYVYIPEDSMEEQTKFDIWGEIHFAKLHENAVKWFRVDVSKVVPDKSRLFSSLAAYSKVHLLPGYPIGLIEGHKLAKSVRDLKGFYEIRLINTLLSLGLTPEDVLDGAVDMDGKEFNSFHELLDQYSR